jgi:CRP/FNR family cyclic AMP-dependent transcriptional regulator
MKHILLIEDNTEIRENIVEILELANYKIDAAENGKIGVELAIKIIPDLIICDVMMPVLDGHGVLHLINKNPALRGIPFIFLTAKSEKDDFRKGMEMGADDYITKPFTEIELLNSIETRLQKNELLKKKYETNAVGVYELLNDLDDKQTLLEFTENSNTTNYNKKELIYKEGNNPVKLFYIQKGRVKTTKKNDDGKELIISLFAEGDFFGYTALLEGTVYKEAAEAMEDTELAIVPKEAFEMLINNNKEVIQKFIQLLAKNITEKEEQLLSLAYNSVRKRVAEALLTLQKKYKVKLQENFSIHISRADLSNIAGTATESLVRTLSDFRNENLIDIKEGYIVILDEKKLLLMLN